MVRRSILVLALALPAWGGAPDPDRSLRWAPTWSAAVEEARALNLPIVLHRHGFYWAPCWTLHRSVLSHRRYIEFSREHCVEVMCMQDIERALEEKPKHAATYKTKDAYGDEIECFAAVPGVTVEQLERLADGEALSYMKGPLMPYTAVIDPHTLEDMTGIQRGEATSAKEFIAVISAHVTTLKERYGPGIDRALWDFVRDGQTRIDLLLGEGELRGALALWREMEERTARQPEVLRRKVDAVREVVLADAADRLDALAAEGGSAARRELARLGPLLAGTPLAERVEALKNGKN